MDLVLKALALKIVLRPQRTEWPGWYWMCLWKNVPYWDEDSNACESSQSRSQLKTTADFRVLHTCIRKLYTLNIKNLSNWVYLEIAFLGQFCLRTLLKNLASIVLLKEIKCSTETLIITLFWRWNNKSSLACILFTTLLQALPEVSQGRQNWE